MTRPLAVLALALAALYVAAAVNAELPERRAMEPRMVRTVSIVAPDPGKDQSRMTPTPVIPRRKP